jgi:subtilisin family serine protease
MTTYTILRGKPRSPDPALLEMGGLEAFAAEAPMTLETADVPEKSVVDVLRDPTVAAAAPEMPTILIAPTSDAAQGPPEWGIAAVGANQSSQTGAGVRVAVLDTGIDAGHEAFKGMTLHEMDFSGDGNGDRHGHGTHCAGTIFGRDVDGKRIGVARGVQEAYIGKVLRDNGGGTSDMLFKAMLWAMHSNVHVISMSLGFDFPGMVKKLVAGNWPTALATSVALEAYRGNLRMFDTIMQMFKVHGPFGVQALVVAASGNESRRDIHPDYRIAASLPAAADGVISVAAVDQSGGQFNVADFSNSMATVCAPGVGIVSAAKGGGLVSMNGTSMACPHVAGVAALWWQKIPGTGVSPSADHVRAQILATAHRPTFHPRVVQADIGIGLVSAPD